MNMKLSDMEGLLSRLKGLAVAQILDQAQSH